ncbi:LOW QUALITY PROTEIN: putative gap junction epsilon-1 protein [Guaruba guarouba]
MAVGASTDGGSGQGLPFSTGRPRFCCARSLPEGLLRPSMVIGFHTLFFGSVMLFLGIWGFAVHGNEALHFSCDPERQVNLFCYFRPINFQVLSVELVIALMPRASFHLHAACKSIKQEDIYQKSFYAAFSIFSAFSRIILEAVVAFWLQIQLFDFKENATYVHNVGALEKMFNITQYVGPKHLAKTVFRIAMYTFTVITVVFVAKISEISCKKLSFSRTL